MNLFAAIVHAYGASTIFVKNFISDVPLSLNTTLEIASHYELSQKAKKLTYLLIKLLLAFFIKKQRVCNFTVHPTKQRFFY